MTGIVLPDIPRLYTALAEWSACVIFITLLKRRFSKEKITLFLLLALLIQSFFLVLTGNIHILLWVPTMIAAVLMMIAIIFICCDISKTDAIYFGILAFVVAEFMASLEWQVYNYIWLGKNLPSPIVEPLFLFVIYGAISLIVWKLLKNHIPDDGRLDVSNKELISALIIAISIFIVSNLSYITQNTPFSGRYSFEIANIRTLVDLGGMTILYAHLVQRSEIRKRRELETMNLVLQNQYIQYQQSKESIDLINYKYHDLKHQINVLRAEEDPDKRNEFLNQMEDEIKLYESQNKTGNKILDTVLTTKSIYCAKNDITLTCVADGTLLDFMDAIDITSIFGNALDNAIESVMKIDDKEKRLIHVTVSRQKDFLMIRIENYYEVELKYQGDTLLTTKKNKNFHGYGIKSIKHIANKYKGGVNINTDNNWFDLQILIPIYKNK